jgi:hypothetical protein
MTIGHRVGARQRTWRDATVESAYPPSKRQRGIRATVRERTARSRMLAQSTKNDGSHRTTNPESRSVATARFTCRSGWAGHLAQVCVTTTRRSGMCGLDVRADSSGSGADRDWTQPDAIQKSSGMGNGRRCAGTGGRRSPGARILCAPAKCVDHAGEKMRVLQRF